LTFFNDLRNYFISQEKSGHVGLLQKRTYGIGSPTSQCDVRPMQIGVRQTQNLPVTSRDVS